MKKIPKNRISSSFNAALLALGLVVMGTGCNDDSNFSPVPPAPSPSPTPTNISAVDYTCGTAQQGQVYFPPAPTSLKGPTDDWGLGQPSCSDGIELNNYSAFIKTTSVFNLDLVDASNPPQQSFVVNIDIATYNKPDKIKISTQDANGNTSVVFSTCTLQTASYQDPTVFTGGQSGYRPLADSIRQIPIRLASGTTRLIFDMSGVQSPIYLRLVGLCGFAANSTTTQMFSDALKSKGPKQNPFFRTYTKTWYPYPTPSDVPVSATSDFLK